MLEFNAEMVLYTVAVEENIFLRQNSTLSIGEPSRQHISRQVDLILLYRITWVVTNKLERLRYNFLDGVRKNRILAVHTV